VAQPVPHWKVATFDAVPPTDEPSHRVSWAGQQTGPPDDFVVIDQGRTERGRRLHLLSTGASGVPISLSVGRLEIDWGKNNGFIDHSALFQRSDLTQSPYYYAGSEKPGTTGDAEWEVIVEMKDGLSKPLAQVVERINLLGHTLAVCEKEFASLAALHQFHVNAFSFLTLQQALAAVDVSGLSPDYEEGEEDFGKLFRRQILPRLGLDRMVTDRTTQFDMAGAMENLSAYSILQPGT
jgi:hypothetical protein